MLGQFFIYTLTIITIKLSSYIFIYIYFLNGPNERENI